eukprot:6197739-Pleurochrysis_carterae.AAC.2
MRGVLGQGSGFYVFPERCSAASWPSMQRLSPHLALQERQLCRWDHASLRSKFPASGGVLNLVVLQEVQKYNELTSEIETTLAHLRLALEGQMSISKELEEASLADVLRRSMSKSRSFAHLSEK